MKHRGSIGRIFLRCSIHQWSSVAHGRQWEGPAEAWTLMCGVGTEQLCSPKVRPLVEMRGDYLRRRTKPPLCRRAPGLSPRQRLSQHGSLSCSGSDRAGGDQDELALSWGGPRPHWWRQEPTRGEATNSCQQGEQPVIPLTAAFSGHVVLGPDRGGQENRSRRASMQL